MTTPPLRAAWPAMLALAVVAAAACSDDEAQADKSDTATATDAARHMDGSPTQDAKDVADLDAATDGAVVDVAEVGDVASPDGDVGLATDTTMTSSDAAPDVELTDAASGSADAGPLDAAAWLDTANQDAQAADSEAPDGEQADTTPPPTLPLPACAANCLVCHQCAKEPLCVDGKTWPSACHAICGLEAMVWPGNHVVEAGACFVSDCAKCTKADKKALHCATLKGGSQVTLNMACEAGCLLLDTSVTPNPAEGACLTPCTKPISQGGAGCPVDEFNPVCSKQDGQSYASDCAMQHCDVAGCFAIGTPGKTSTCVPFQMSASCSGLCYSKALWPNCPETCAPVCRFNAAGKGVSYRNTCIADAEGAKAGSCEGISASKYDKCSVDLYETLGKGCCPGVDYADIKQVCASIGDGKDEEFYTFRNLKEYACLIKGSAKPWKFQFQGPCLCNCTKIAKPVCGADGKTYQNLCQAECYGGPGFKTTPGSCPGG